MKKESLIFIIIIIVAIGSDEVFSIERNRQGPPPLNLQKIRQEVQLTPTTPENIRVRFRAIMQWVPELLNRGAAVKDVLSKDEADILQRQVAAQECPEACLQVDRVYKGFERLAAEDYAKQDNPLKIDTDLVQEKPLSKSQGKQIHLPVNAQQVTIIDSLPNERKGSAVIDTPNFSSYSKTTIGGELLLNINDEPTWVIEGPLPPTPNLSAEKSPFGLHPAGLNHGPTHDFDFALDLGVNWDRGGYFLWIIGQPDIEFDTFSWQRYDKYMQELPGSMRVLKNITVVHNGMIKRPNRPQFIPKGKKVPDVTKHLSGSSYRPKDEKAYRKWVQAVVERYDGDGFNDMPGLTVPIRFWQVDNEPPQGRDGYADLLRVTNQAIKEADSGGTVLIGGLLFPFDYQKELYSKIRRSVLDTINPHDLDVLDFHWYGVIGEWKDFSGMYAKLKKDLTDRRLGNAPIWITEMCTYSGEPQRGGEQDYGHQSEIDQASELVKRHVVALNEGVAKIFWVGLMEGFQNPNDNDFFDISGLVYDGNGKDDPGNGVKKIAYWTYQKMTSLLGYWDGSRPVKIDMGPDVSAFRFPFAANRKDGIVVIWLN